MTNKFAIFWKYKIFTETLLSEDQENAFLNVLCEIAELEFLSQGLMLRSRQAQWNP